jgi:hypothetical protein
MYTFSHLPRIDRDTFRVFFFFFFCNSYPNKCAIHCGFITSDFITSQLVMKPMWLEIIRHFFLNWLQNKISIEILKMWQLYCSVIIFNGNSLKYSISSNVFIFESLNVTERGRCLRNSRLARMHATEDDKYAYPMFRSRVPSEVRCRHVSTRRNSVRSVTTHGVRELCHLMLHCLFQTFYLGKGGVSKIFRGGFHRNE